MSHQSEVSVNLRRDWIQASGLGTGTPENGDGSGDKSDSFTLMNYNILADCHIKDGWYPYCPEGFRKMSERHKQLMVELGHHNPDVVCLQEVGPDYFAQQLNPDMFALGYYGLHVNKVRGIREGGATFYKKERFQMVEERGVVFNELIAKECQKAQLSEEAQERVMAYTNQDHLVLLTKLQDLRTRKTLSVGNTHLLFDDYKNVDIITLQAGLAINALVEFAGGVDQPHILCGDFNQEPTMTGYQLLHDGKLDGNGEQFIRQYPIKIGDQSKSLLDIFPHCFKHKSTSLKSAYKEAVGQEVPFSDFEDYTGAVWSKDIKLPVRNSEHPPAKRPRKTYFTDSKMYAKEIFIAALDYQWFSSSKLRCLGTAEMVDERDVHPFYACPNEVFPSDHLSIVSKYEFKE